MKVDPVASMRCWAIVVQIGGREYEIPALPAADWWPVLVGASPGRVIDLIPSRLGEGDDLDTILLSGALDTEELGAALREAVEEVTGRSFHAAAVLALVADHQWPVIGGRLAQTGFRWDVQPIGAALDAIYALVVSNLDKEALEKFLDILDDESISDPDRKRTPSERVIAEFETMAGPRPAPRPIPGRSTGAPSDSAPPKTPPPRQPRRRDARSS